MEAVEKFGDKGESQIATHIKRALDRVHYPCWHCIVGIELEFDNKLILVGKSYFSWVTHESKKFAFFYVGPYAILVWKYG